MKRVEVQFKDICRVLNELQTLKGKSYGLMDIGEQESWNKEGEIGAYFTVKRKIDRLEKAIKDGLKNGGFDAKGNFIPKSVEGESLIDTLADMAVYFTKWVQWYANDLDREAFDNWRISNKLVTYKHPYEIANDE